MNWAPSVLARLLWLLYQPLSTHRPHMYPTVRNGGGRRVRQGSNGPAPLPLDSTLLKHSSLQQSYFEKTTTKAPYFFILSSIILWIRFILLFTVGLA